jgi:hypothetical protein
MNDHIGDDELDEIAILAESATPGPWYVRLLDDESAMNIVAVSTIPGDGPVMRYLEFDHSEIVAATLVQHPRYVDVADGRWDENAGPEAHVWLGVLNNADLEKVRQHFAAIPWQLPNAVQLFMRDEGEDYFRVWMLRRGQVEQYVTAKPDEQDRDYWPGWWLELHGNI